MHTKTRLLSMATVVVACVLLATAVLVEKANDDHYQSDVRTAAFEDLTVIAAHLETVVYADAGRVSGLGGVVAANPRLGRDGFERAARVILGPDSAIRSFTIAPQMVISQVFPLRGNEMAIGLDLTAHPMQREAALAARDHRVTVIAGPFDLAQGGNAMVARAPVFIAEGGQDRFWGLVSAAIDPRRLFQSAGMLADELRYDLALRGADAKGATGPVFFGRADLFTADPVIVDVRLPYGSWQLAAMPRGGWPAKAPNVWRIRLGFILVSILILGPILGLGRSMRALGAAKTRLDSERRRFNATLENTPNVGVQWYRRDGAVIYWNRASEAIYGWSPKEMAGQTVERLLAEDEYRRFLGLLQMIADGGEPHGPVEFVVRRRDGEERVVLSTLFPIPGEDGRIVVCMDVDITESRRLAQMQKDTLESIPDAVVVVDQQGRIVQVNQQTLRLFGYSDEELIGRDVEILVPESARDRHMEERGRYISAPRIRNMGSGLELTACTRDGRLIPVDVCLGPVRSTSGFFVVATLRDISESKRVMADLRAARDRAQRYLDTVQTVMVSLDSDGTIAMINRKGCELLGYAENELLGQDWFATCVPTDLAVSLRGEFAMSVAGRDFPLLSSQNEVVCRDGRRRLIAWHNALLRDEKLDIAGILCSGEDITDRVAAESLLRDSEQRFAFAVEGAGDGVWDWDVETDQLLCSRTCMQMFGGDREEIHCIDDWFKRIHSDDRAMAIKARDDIVAGRISSFAQEFRAGGGQGEVKWVLCRAKVVEFDQNDKPLRMIGIMTDVSARKRGEEELRLARDAAEEANRAKSRFLANMSHELRTPLNAIIGFAQMLDFGAPAPIHEAQKEPVGHILRSGRHLLQIINDLLDLARIESGRLELLPEDLRLSPIIGEVIALCRPIADERGIVIAFSGGSALAVRADRVRLRQVLLNLLSNAIKYNREHGRVGIDCRAAERIVRIRVSDTGAGIPRDRRAEAFLPFHRLGAEHGVIEGTGIGLAVTKQLVEAMGGRIGIDDGDNAEGAAFWVELPLVSVPDADVSESTGTDSSVDAKVGAGQVVLYIEDNPVNLRLMQHVFAKRPGAVLVCAEEAEQGLRLAREHRPAIILLDINLPVMDGYGVLRELRADPATRDTPVIAITANAMKGDRERAETAGFAEYLTKPLNIVALYEALDRFLGGAPVGQPGVKSA